MGRTYRIRRKKSKCVRPESLSENDEVLPFIKWIVSNGWKPTCKLKIVDFPDTGRGIMAMEPIPVGTTLVKSPFKLLITVNTVSESILGSVFNKSKITFTTQQVLATFLAWEKHLGDQSLWHNYIKSLPKKYTSPLFCTDSEIENFSQSIKNKVLSTNANIKNSHSMVEGEVKSLCCQHCKLEYTSILNFDNFKWAWFTTNSRCVYISPDINVNTKIKLSDSNCLAMSPFLDLINHSNEAKVNAFFNIKDSTYTVTTLVPFRKYDQVFINYGSHSNVKLFIDYGFILPKNHHDVVVFSSQEILVAATKLEPSLKTLITARYEYLKKHNFLTDLSCGSDGLSWNAKVMLFVLSAPASANLFCINRDIFSGSMLTQSKFILIAKSILNTKKLEIEENLGKIQNPNNTIQIYAELLKENLSILLLTGKKIETQES